MLIPTVQSDITSTVQSMFRFSSSNTPQDKGLEFYNNEWIAEHTPNLELLQ